MFSKKATCQHAPDLLFASMHLRKLRTQLHFSRYEDFLAALVGLDHTSDLESRKMLGDS